MIGLLRSSSAQMELASGQGELSEQARIAADGPRCPRDWAVSHAAEVVPDLIGRQVFAPLVVAQVPGTSQGDLTTDQGEY
eukprot:scaffold320718_cov42-Prasinocladus_malaysianus.AAC.1